MVIRNGKLTEGGYERKAETLVALEPAAQRKGATSSKFQSA